MQIFKYLIGSDDYLATDLHEQAVPVAEIDSEAEYHRFLKDKKPHFYSKAERKSLEIPADCELICCTPDEEIYFIKR